MSIKSSNNSSENKTEYNKVNAQTYTRNDILICATHGHIYAIRKSNGTNIWDAKFPTSVSGGLISVFITDSDKLIFGGFGKTACMDLLTGNTIWVNNMPVSLHHLHLLINQLLHLNTHLYLLF